MIFRGCVTTSWCCWFGLTCEDTGAIWWLNQKDKKKKPSQTASPRLMLQITGLGFFYSLCKTKIAMKVHEILLSIDITNSAKCRHCKKKRLNKATQS